MKSLIMRRMENLMPRVSEKSLSPALYPQILWRNLSMTDCECGTRFNAKVAPFASH